MSTKHAYSGCAGEGMAPEKFATHQRRGEKASPGFLVSPEGSRGIMTVAFEEKQTAVCHCLLAKQCFSRELHNL